MDLRLTWHKPVQLRKARAGSTSIYDLDLTKAPAKPGVYIFMRRFGKKLSPLYVGKAGNLRVRMGQQLNALKLMKGIQNAAIGRRAVVFGEFVARPGQKEGKCLLMIEKALIRHFLSEGHDLLNVLGARITTRHVVTSDKVAGYFIPHKIRF
jgi:excinuclease UvrABC nuclease subunit